MRNKIAFIKLRSFSHINEKIEKQLIKNFPTFKVETIDVFDLFKYRIPFLINFFFIIKEFGLDILLGKKKIQRCFFMTSYFFHYIKSTIPKRLSNNQYAFSFQTQSHFDASSDGLPHFVYTDHTYLANFYYSSFNKYNLFSNTLIDLEKNIYKNATLNFTMSNNISKSLIDQYSCSIKKIVCVYAGYNITIDNTKNVNNRYNNKTILFVGNDWERKGGPELIKAFIIVLQSCPDAKLIIVGCSPKINIKNCKVIGKISPKEVIKYYQKSSIFCLPTKIEPFGIVFLEAMACKLPVIGTNLGAIPDFICNGKNGYLVEEGNIEQLVSVLLNLINDPEKCKDFGEKGSEVVRNRYSWDQVGLMIKKNIEPFINIDMPPHPKHL